MDLKAKFNLTILLAFVVGLTLTATFSWRASNRNTREEVLNQASIMLSVATSIRNYTDSENGPVLSSCSRERFFPQTIPFFVAETNIHTLARKFPAYAYKEAALNPMNPADTPADWEAAIIGMIRQNLTLTTPIITRITPQGPRPRSPRHFAALQAIRLTCEVRFPLKRSAPT